MSGLLVAIAMSKTTGATFINIVWKMLLMAEPLLSNTLTRSTTVHTAIDVSIKLTCPESAGLLPSCASCGTQGTNREDG
jgi:hypothetical protein